MLRYSVKANDSSGFISLLLAIVFALFVSACVTVESVRRDAERGDPDAQYLLGNLYATGRGVSKDYSQTVRWYRKAADQGHKAGSGMWPIILI